MKKYIIDEKTGISYTLQGDYYPPVFAYGCAMFFIVVLTIYLLPVVSDEELPL